MKYFNLVQELKSNISPYFWKQKEILNLSNAGIVIFGIFNWSKCWFNDLIINTSIICKFG